MKRLGTAEVSNEILLAEFNWFVDLLREKSIYIVEVVYCTDGWVNWHQDNIKVENLKSYFENKVLKNNFELGYQDLFLKHKKFEFQLGNDKDLIFESTDEELFTIVLKELESKGIKFIQQSL